MREIDSHALRAQLVATAEVISVRLWRLTALARQGGPEIASRVGVAAADIAALSSAATSELARTRVNAIDELGGLYAVQAMQERALGMIDALERGAVDACLPERGAMAPVPRPLAPPAPAMERAPAPAPRPVPTSPAMPQAQSARPLPASSERSTKASRRAEHVARERPFRRGAMIAMLPQLSAAVMKRAVAALAVLVAGGAAGWAYMHHGDRARAGWQRIADTVMHPVQPAAKSTPVKQIVASTEAAPLPPEPVADRVAYAAVLMTGPDQRAVTTYFNEMRQSHPDLFANATAKIQPVSGEGSGRQFRLAALPLRTKEQALKLCETLRARGVSGCLVRRM